MDEGEEADIDPLVSTCGMRSQFGLSTPELLRGLDGGRYGHEKGRLGLTDKGDSSVPKKTKFAAGRRGTRKLRYTEVVITIT